MNGNGRRGAAAHMTLHRREFDVVVYGASGFTGRLIASYLAGRCSFLRVGLAGRCADRLREARDGAAAASGRIDWDPALLVAGAGDDAALRGLAARTNVVLSAAGPFSLFGTPLVRACVREQTDYVDINGEVPWVRSVIERFDHVAAERGTLVVPNCGCSAFHRPSRTAHPAHCCLQGTSTPAGRRFPVGKPRRDSLPAWCQKDCAGGLYPAARPHNCCGVCVRRMLTPGTRTSARTRARLLALSRAPHTYTRPSARCEGCSELAMLSLIHI